MQREKANVFLYAAVLRSRTSQAEIKRFAEEYWKAHKAGRPLEALERLDAHVQDSISDAYGELKRAYPDVADVADFQKVGQWLVSFIVKVDGHSDRIYRDIHTELRWADGILNQPESDA